MKALPRPCSGECDEVLLQQAPKPPEPIIFCAECVELPLVELVGGVEIPFSFLTNSLKRIIIGRAENPEDNLPANKAIWLVCFCPLLRQAILTTQITTQS